MTDSFLVSIRVPSRLSFGLPLILFSELFTMLASF